MGLFLSRSLSRFYEPNQAHVSDQHHHDHDNDQVAASRYDETWKDFKTLSYNFEGSFEEAKSYSASQNVWLIVNLLAKKEIASREFNRHVWENEAVWPIVESNFILWQVYDYTLEGQKIPCFYKIDCVLPVVLLIDPITGLKMKMWSGVIEAEGLVEDLMKYCDVGPYEYFASLRRNRSPAALSNDNRVEVVVPSWGEEFEEEDNGWSNNNTDQAMAPSWGEEFEHEDNYWQGGNYTDQPMAASWGEEFEEKDAWWSSNNTYEAVAPSWGEEFEQEDFYWSSNNVHQVEASSWGHEFEEPTEEKEDEICLEFPNLTEEPKGDCDVCKLCVRFPDGRRKHRMFLKTEPIQLLWSFCYSQMEASERKMFKLVQAIPGASKTLDYEANVTFDQSGLANSLISVTWE